MLVSTVQMQLAQRSVQLLAQDYGTGIAERMAVQLGRLGEDPDGVQALLADMVRDGADDVLGVAIESGGAIELQSGVAIDAIELGEQARAEDECVRRFRASLVESACPIDSVTSVIVRTSAADEASLVRAVQSGVVLYTILSVLLVGVAGFLLLTRWIVRPIRTLDTATERVASGDLATRSSTYPGNEIGSLSKNFDRMVASLRGSREALQQRVDELRESNERLEATRDELVRSEKLATIGQLAAGIAHEVGNPLSAVLGMVELMGDEGLDADDREDLARRILAELRRMDGTIHELLDYARGTDMDVGPTSITEPVQSAVRLCAHHERARSLTIHEDHGKNLPAVEVDSGRIRQVFVNLLVNAADAYDGPGDVWISSRADGGSVIVEVRDAGPGIPADKLGRVFDPFFSTKGRGQGTGMGLAICERLVEQADGTIRVKSKVGEGTTFTIELPAQIPSGK